MSSRELYDGPVISG